MNPAIFDFIVNVIPKEDILVNEPMSKHTTFRVGGEAKYVLIIRDKNQLIKLIPYLHKMDENYFIIGNGSNLLVGDKGYSGIIVKLGSEMESIRIDGEKITVSAGTTLAKAAAAARDGELTGMEFASGIPGTVGGSIVMNAGAYEGEMKQIVENVEVMDSQGEILLLDNDTMEFGYRTSVVKNRPFIILEATLKLNKGNKEEITAKMEELGRRRREKQPLEYASAGSTFKRPQGHFAGKLIMDAGLRGYSIGGARVADKHCGFVINTGHASAADVREVIEEVQQKVKDLFNVSLEREVIYLGDF